MSWATSARALALALCGWLAAPDSRAASPVVVDGNGGVVGIWIAASGGERQTVVSRTGYCFAIYPRTARLAEWAADCFFGASAVTDLWYEAEDCSGTPLAQVSAFVRGGFVSPVFSTGAVHYAPRGAIPVSRSLMSRGIPENCSAAAETADTVPFLPNEPAVTGVPGETFAAPLELIVLEGCVFGNGFECPVP